MSYRIFHFLYDKYHTGDRIAAERNCVAKATRRRRGISQARFFVLKIGKGAEKEELTIAHCMGIIVPEQGRSLIGRERPFLDKSLKRIRRRKDASVYKKRNLEDGRRRGRGVYPSAVYRYLRNNVKYGNHGQPA